MYRGVNSSGNLLVASTPFNIAAQSCYIHAVILNPGAAACSITVYDNSAGAASGPVIAKLEGVANGASVDIDFSNPITCSNGASADLSGAGSSGLVYYSIVS